MTLVFSLLVAAAIAWIIAGWLDDYEEQLDQEAWTEPLSWSDEPAAEDAGKPSEEKEPFG